jgi:sigma-B regulation protein RsbU (phosphoserine phosphatase)
MNGQATGTRAGRFWQRVTEGMRFSELWRQFRAEAQTSYRLYSQDLDGLRTPGHRKGRHFFQIERQFLWAVLEKITPARRVLLLVALAFLILPLGDWVWNSQGGHVHIQSPDFRAVGGLLMFVLLIMEVGDRVVMKRDLQIAKEIQAWLLPSEPPRVPGLEIAFTTRPANTVAGDYYDVFPRPGGQGTWLIAIADVAGKSMPAALLMATFQASLKTLSGIPGPLPELAAQINHYACTNSQNGRRFTTAFLAEFDPAARRLTYVNAGHNSPILLRTNGAVERLEAGGVPLGILDETTYVSRDTTLQAGDWLAAFTDGVVEAENRAERQYGEERLVTMLRWGAQMPPAMLLQSVVEDIDRFVENAPQHDDITCVLVRGI